ncbi:MAG: sigma-70 family RNA polymerase sigma factor [Chloroflexota bacterium]
MNQRSNEEWVNELRDPVSDEALTDLRNILLRGLRAALSSRIHSDLESITEDFAQEALLKILKSIESFRGESRFTTWAQKIAIHVAFTELRRRRWKDISLQKFIETPDGDEYTPAILTDPSASPERKASQHSALEIVQDLIETELTERQKTAIYAVMQGGMPLEEVARKMGTNRNALYKLIQDARQRLQLKLVEKAGMTAQEILALFSNE